MIHRKYKAEVWDSMQFLFSAFNDHQIHCVIRLDGRLEEGRLICAVDRLAELFPLIRCRFVPDKIMPYWEEAEQSGKDMVFVKETDHVDEEIEKVICSQTDTLNGPQMLLHILRGSDSDSLCILINHMLCDGAGFKELIYLLCSLYTHLKEDSHYHPGAESIRRDERQVLNEFGWKDKLRIVFQRYNLSRHDNRIVLGLDGDRNTPFIVTHTISGERFLAAKAFAKQQGATVNDLLLAAYLRALHQFLPGKPTAIQCILDLRKYLPSSSDRLFCNLTSTLVCDVGLDDGTEFADTLRKVKKRMDDEKKQVSCLHLILLLDIVFRFLPFSILRKVVLREYSNPPLAMSNIGIIDHKRLVFDGVAVQDAFMTGSIKYNPYVQLALSTFQDKVTMSIAFHGTQADKNKLRCFLQAIEKELPC